MNNFKKLLTACALVCLLAGCAEPKHFEAVDQLCVPAVRKAQAMQAAQDVLGRMHFTIAKVDTELGLITTRPLQAAQFFEFWRSDTVGAFNSAEANLHSIRRIVQLNIARQGAKLCIGCEVQIQRLNLSERKSDAAALSYGGFPQGRAPLQKLEINSKQKAWVNLGRDTKLETVILKRLEDKIIDKPGKEKKL